LSCIEGPRRHRDHARSQARRLRPTHRRLGGA
jgi:hypothetical protein